ncbi:MAG: hypothetical protein A2Z14_15035 [Chloroflexi bacterium RBG_16_48_8]|nr:MAG: hypothetical protein A2Z14_15035 [Chloroflexi bacterium RBG_16_48_8]
MIVDPTPTLLTIPDQGTATPSSDFLVRVGYSSQDFTLEDLFGELHSLSEHQGQVVLINFWTTWCPPCKEEMPALQEVYDRYRDRGFIVLGVNWTEVDELEQIGPFVQELGLTFPILLDVDSSVSEDLYQLLGLPTSVFIGRDGIIRKITIGALQIETLETMIQSMLEETL